MGMKKTKISFIIISLVFNIISAPIAEKNVYSSGISYDDEFNINSKSVTINSNGTYRIYGTYKQTNNSIVVSDGLDDVYITIDNINIKVTDENVCPLEIKGNSNVTLELVGNNTLISNYYTAAVQVNKYDDYLIGSLKIIGNGILNATGGRYAAAIGGDYKHHAGNIEVHSGTINAIGGDKSAGIGGSYNNDAGQINILGGIINAEGAGGGAGIGGGYHGDVEIINISGGEIRAKGSEGGAGIGGGYRGRCGEVNINNSNVTAFASENANGIGCGKYASGSRISIKNSEIAAFSSDNAYAIENKELYTDSLILFSGIFSNSYFEDDEKLIFKTGNYQKEITIPYEYHNFTITLDKTGVYSIKTSSDIDIFYKENNNYNDKFDIKSGVNFFKIQPECTCTLTQPKFTISNVILGPNKVEESVKLSASGCTYTLGKDCMIHSKKHNVSFEYSIKEDVAGIAKIINKTLMLNVPLEGEYKVVATVKAKAGDLEQTKDAQFMVIKQSDPYEMKSNMVIDKNGVYTIRTYTRQHSIIVQQDLDDVTLVLDNVTIDLSENPNSTGIPIMIKSRSKVNIVLKGTNTLISNKAGCPITLAPSPDDNNTQVKIMGSGRLTVKNPYEGSAIGSIGDGTSTEIVLLEGNINAEAVNGPVFGSQTSFNNCSVFISDKVNLTGFNRSNKYNPVQGVIRTTDFEEYNPAIIVQVKLEGKLPVDSTTIELYCSRPRSVKNIYDIEKDCSGFVTTVKSFGDYTVSFTDKDGFKKYFVQENDNESDEKYIEVFDYFNNFSITYKKCKCKISAPAFKLENIEIPYDRYNISITLRASDAKLTLDKDCAVHEMDWINYKYRIIEDEYNIAELEGRILRLYPTIPGKYKVKVRAIAYIEGISTNKDATITVTKLSREETDEKIKKLGEEHQAYITGYDDDTFRPDNSITRAEVATIVARISPDFNESRSYNAQFSDIKSGDWHYKYIAFMQQKGYINGYEDNTYRPDNPMTRAEFTALICNFNKITPSSSRSKFDDISGHWAEGYITALTSKKIVNGYPGGIFKPEEPITRAEVVTIINKILDRAPKNKKKVNTNFLKFEDLSEDHWAFYDILEASHTHYEKEWH